MKFFKIHTWCFGNGAKAVLSFNAPLNTQQAAAPFHRGATALGFSAFPCKKDPSKAASSIHAQRREILYVCWFMPQSKACSYLQNKEFTRHFVIKQVSHALKMWIQTLLVGRAWPGYKIVLDFLLSLRQKFYFSSPQSSCGMRIEIVFSSTNCFCESRNCCYHHHVERVLKY